MLKAVIFDMDGLMIDSEPIQSQAFEAMLRHHGAEPVLNESGLVQTIASGNNYEDLKERYGLKASIEELKKYKRAVHTDLINQGVVPMPGLHNLLEILASHPVKLAIASSSNPGHIKLIMSQLGILDRFNVIASVADVPRGKPAPDVFLEAAHRLGVAPADCIVLEDALAGILGAKAAGMKAIAIPTRHTAHQDFTPADLVVSSLENLDW